MCVYVILEATKHINLLISRPITTISFVLLKNFICDLIRRLFKKNRECLYIRHIFYFTYTYIHVIISTII